MEYSDGNKYTLPVLTKIAAWWILADCLVELVGAPIAWKKFNFSYYLAGDYAMPEFVLIFCWLVSLCLLISAVALLVTRRKARVRTGWWVTTTLLLLIQLLVTPLEGGALGYYTYHWDGWGAFMFQRIPLIMYVPPFLLMLTDFGNLLLEKKKAGRYKE